MIQRTTATLVQAPTHTRQTVCITIFVRAASPPEKAATALVWYRWGQYCCYTGTKVKAKPWLSSCAMQRQGRKRYPQRPKVCGKTRQVTSSCSTATKSKQEVLHKRSSKACCLHKLSSDWGRGCAISSPLFSVQQVAVAHNVKYLLVHRYLSTACAKNARVRPSPWLSGRLSLFLVFCLSVFGILNRT